MGDIVRKKWMTMMNVHAGAVETIYGGPVGLIWEMLAGKEEDCANETTDTLAEQAGIGQGSRVLLLLPGPGGPARCIAERHSCTVIGLLAIPQMVDAAIRRTEKAGLIGQVDFRQGNALDLPFRERTFDTVWGEDTWCYVTDRDRMIREAFRVLKPGGTLGIIDWMQIREGDELRQTRDTFRIFPYFETLASYARLLEQNGFVVRDRGEVLEDPEERIREIHALLRRDQGAIVDLLGDEAYDDARKGLDLWEEAAGRGLVGRGWLSAKRP